MTDFIFYRRFVRVALVMCYLYLGVNYSATKASGKPTYWFMKWSNPLESGLTVLFFSTVAIVLVHFLAFVTEIAKARRLPIIERVKTD